MPIDETRNCRIVFVVKHETREQLELLAKRDRRALGAFLRCMCEDYVEEHKDELPPRNPQAWLRS